MPNRNKSEQWKISLNQYGLKATPQRLEILDALDRASLPMSADELSRALKSQADPVTVYRNLAAFEKLSLVRRVDFRTGSARFELAASHHHHLVCTSCNRVEDFARCDINQLASQILRRSKKFVEIQEHALELFGLCQTCAK